MSIYFKVGEESDGYLIVIPVAVPTQEISRQFQNWEDFVVWYKNESDDVDCEAFNSPLYRKTVEVLIVEEE